MRDINPATQLNSPANFSNPATMPFVLRASSNRARILLTRSSDTLTITPLFCTANSAPIQLTILSKRAFFHARSLSTITQTKHVTAAAQSRCLRVPCQPRIWVGRQHKSRHGHPARCDTLLASIGWGTQQRVPKLTAPTKREVSVCEPFVLTVRAHSVSSLLFQFKGRKRTRPKIHDEKLNTPVHLVIAFKWRFQRLQEVKDVSYDIVSSGQDDTFLNLNQSIGSVTQCVQNEPVDDAFTETRTILMVPSFRFFFSSFFSYIFFILTFWMVKGTSQNWP